jgi:hypothetical protein
MKVGAPPLAPPEDAIVGAKSGVVQLAPPEGAAADESRKPDRWHRRRHDNRLNCEGDLMLLIVLTSISVVVAARWQRELKIYTDLRTRKEVM